jgi:arylsulfatase A-like enzyme
MDKLKSLGISDNTIVIFYSDNGGMSAANFYYPERIVDESELDVAYSTSNLPLRGAKGWLYEGGVRVPMIVKWPGMSKKGIACEEPITSTDFFPSILEMAGLPARPDQHMDGMSFVPALKGDDFDRKAVYWHFPHYSNHGMQSPGGAIRFGDYKLLEYFENNTIQLFNLKEDPGEQHNLARTQPEKARELLTMLHEWREDVSAAPMVPK